MPFDPDAYLKEPEAAPAAPPAFDPDAYLSAKPAASVPKGSNWRDYIPDIVQIESGGNPNARTGQYTGVLQMGRDERAKYGGDSLEHGTRLLEDRAAELTRRLGREPTGPEVYFAHQQGVGGSAEHLSNPDRPAWQSMYATAEGQQKGPGWAKLAIWGNLPASEKAKYGNVENVTSGNFANFWNQRVEREHAKRTGGSQIAVAGSPIPPNIDPRMLPAPDQLPPFDPDAYLGNAPVAPSGDQGTATAGQALARGYYKTKGMVGGTAEVLGEATGYQPLQEFGTGVRQQAAQDVQSYPAQAEFLKIRSASDAAQYAKETLLDFMPQIGGSLAGGVAGGLVGGPVGAVVGAGLPSLILNTGDIQQQLKEKDPNAVAPGWVAAGGTAAAALDTITPFRLGSKLLMRFGKETGEEIAKATLERSAAKEFALGVGKEAGKSAGIEGTTEALQEVIGEMATSGALDRTPDWASLPVRMTESFAAGALGGAAFGGGAHALAGKPAVREGGVGELPPEPAPPPPPAPEPYGPPREPYGPPEGYGPPKEPFGPPKPVPPTPPMGEPPEPGAFPPSPLPVGTWVENVPKGAVQLLGPTEKGPVQDRPKKMSPSAAVGGTDEISPSIAMKAPEGDSVTLYHGTTKAFDTLDPAFATNKYEGATFFSSNPEHANAYAEGEGGRVFRARVNENSLYHPSEAELQAFAEKGDFVQQALEQSKKMGKVGVHFDLNGDHIYALHDLAPVTLGSEMATSDRFMTDGATTTHLDNLLKSRPLGSTSLPPAADLTIARIAWQAVNEGKDRVSWPMENTAEAKAMTAAAKRLAATLPGARVAHGFMDVPSDTLQGARVRNNLSTPFLELSPEAKEALLARGSETASEALDFGGKIKNVASFLSARKVANPWQVGDVKDARPEIQQASEFVWRLARKLGITKPITIIIRPFMPREPTAMAHVWGLDKQGRYRGGNFIGKGSRKAEDVASYAIELGLNHHPTIDQVYASLSHELAHIVHGEFYFRSSPLLKLQIDEAFRRFNEEKDRQGIKTFNPLLMLRDNFIVNWYDMRAPVGQRAPPGVGRSTVTYDVPLKDMQQREYFLSFEEWFAEQGARHFTTSPVVLNAVDRFFSKLGKALREIYTAFKAKFGISAEPDTWIGQWLDSRLTEMPMVAAAAQANQEALADANTRAMKGIGVTDYPSTRADVTSIAGRKVMASIGESPEARAMAAAGDRFNGFYRWMLSVVQVAARNLHIQPLQRYVELWQQKQLERAQMMTGGIETLRAWRNLGKKQADNVSAMLDAYMNMDFLTPVEYLNNVVRRPTPDELVQLQKDHGLNAQARAVFDKVTSDFDTMLLRYEALLRAEARKISDPAALLKRMNEITAQIEKMKLIPYAPAMRFGDLVLLIKDQDGNVRSRYHYETEAKRRRGRTDLEKKLLPGEKMEETAIPEQAKPFMGLPPGLLDLIAEKLELSDAQRKTIAELKYEYAPAHGFQHRFQRKSRVPGYSMDFMRAYASYFFHGSNYFTNVKYVQALRDEIGLTKLSADGLENGTKRIQIHNFMNEHLNYMLDPKPDFTHLRGIMFHWGLGFSPAAAFINLSQMALGSYPFLGGKFGDVATVSAMLRAGTNLSTFYKRGTLAANTAARDMRALSEGVKQGIITEAMAPELAGLTEQDNLRKGSFGKAAELARLFAEASSFMFQTTEQVNRRVTFRAAWQLALDNPTAKYVKEMINKHSLQYESLIQQGWAQNEAAAFVVAKDATESTQFIYHQWANPAFMRGKFRTVFMFKNFLQNTMFMLWHYPEARVRSLLVFAFLGGMMGLPGADDMKSIIKAVGWRLFGKDWDVEDEARRLVIDMTSGKINPDLLLHGASRYGFGAQALMGLMGVPFPTVDLSRSIGLGRLLPADPNTLLGQGASKDPKKALLDSVTQVAGYAFQTNANFYNALTDTQLSWSDAQRWTKAMPRALSGLSKSYQALRGDDPAIRTRTGAAVIRFDTSDSVQLMEALSMAAGFQPQRLTQKWDVIMAQREAQEFWKLKREGLLRQAWQTRGSDDKENYSRAIQAIRDFNENLPPEARTQAITADNIIQSFRSRATSTAKMELGLPSSMKDVPLVRSIQELYPGADIDVRRTR